MKTVCLAGVVGKDAVLRRTQNGDPVLGFSLAVDDGYGENKSTMWFDVSIFGKRGTALESHIRKGMRLTAVGEFGLREHEGKYYPMCRAMEVELQGGGEARQEQRSTQRQEPAQSFRQELSDDLPFAPEWRI